MQASVTHRKRIRHFNIARQAHELTFSCRDRAPLLADDERRVIVHSAIRAACERLRYDVLAYVLMPEHVHLVVLPRESGYDVAALLFAIKRPASFRIKRSIAARSDDELAAHMVRERPGRVVFRFWQEGPGFDRNIGRLDTLSHVVEYIHANPVRRGLCRRPVDWRWSSAGQYAGAPPANGAPKVRRLV